MCAFDAPEKTSSSKRAPDKIRSLYEECLSKEKDLRENPHPVDDIRQVIAWGLVFPEQQFRPAHGRESIFAKLRLKEKLSAEEVEILITEGTKYLVLLRLLRKAPNRDTRWIWIAQWLFDEGAALPIRSSREMCSRG